jgi:two-component system, NarL family, invasion response regulator UvrY
MAKILIVEDHPVFRRGLKDLLLRGPHIAAVGEAENAQEALRLLNKGQWDLAVVDIDLPGKSGLELLNDLKRDYPKLPVLILSMYAEDQYGMRTLKSGASGYLTKDRAPEEILKAIAVLLQGRKYVSDSLAEQLANHLVNGTDKSFHELLSDREYEILKNVSAGKRPREIAAELHISPRTVGSYRARILDKLNLKNTSELIRYAIQHKLVK